MSIEKIPIKQNPEEEKMDHKFNPEKSTDTEIALFYIEHIDNPCEVPGIITDAGKNLTIRKSWLELAEKALRRMENPYAKKLLLRKIEEYKNR